ncbi:hypothetical protein GCM10022259_39830 [Aquimarina mytili]
MIIPLTANDRISKTSNQTECNVLNLMCCKSVMMYGELGKKANHIVKPLQKMTLFTFFALSRVVIRYGIAARNKFQIRKRKKRESVFIILISNNAALNATDAIRLLINGDRS